MIALPTPSSAATTRFPGGQLVSTPAALEVLTSTDIQTALTRHFQGDWGDCGPEDAAANDQALQSTERLFSVYHSAAGVRFWVITEADRSVTTVLLPDDY
ncbi:hypothetical protein SH661x_002864 [Planctomicrobium sp. SH661]|uniref:hypothetical protein n=1 Tax=Planctomicrobium sp. SH661 TaxID=3448124 RepID=UPI003F5B76D5